MPDTTIKQQTYDKAKIDELISNISSGENATVVDVLEILDEGFGKIETVLDELE